MIVTIDGPAGAGKSSVARAVAERLGFCFLDTGAMYRAVAFAALRHQWPLDQPDEVARRARALKIEVQGQRVLVDGDDVTPHLRTSQVSDHVYAIADNPRIREQMVELQRAFARGKNIVTEGRDQGTVVFPNAECKIFLTASPEERACRRLRELVSAGERVTFEDVLKAQRDRDHRDETRPVGALVKAPDAVVVSSDGMSRQEVIDRLVTLIEERQSTSSRGPEVSA